MLLLPPKIQSEICRKLCGIFNARRHAFMKHKQKLRQRPGSEPKQGCAWGEKWERPRITKIIEIQLQKYSLDEKYFLVHIGGQKSRTVNVVMQPHWVKYKQLS